MAESAQELLQQGIAAAQAGQKDQARRLLQQAVRLDPQNELTWLWLSSVAKDSQERIFCLRQLLQINPQHEMALKGLRALGVSVQDEGDVEVEAQAHGVPVISERALAAAQPELDRVLQTYGARPEEDLAIEWAHKNRGRYGERAATVLTGGVVFAVVAVMAVVLLVAAAIVVPVLTRSQPTPTPIIVSFRATSTLTPTLGPTNTPFPTPRISPVPSSTYHPSVPDGNQALEDHNGVLTATPVYFYHSQTIRMNNLADAYIAGRYDEVPELADLARQDVRIPIDSFFYEGMAYAHQGDFERAERAVLDGMDQGSSNLLDAALGYIYYHQGRYEESTEYNLRAIEADSRLELPSLTQADVYIATGAPGRALQLLDQVFSEQPTFDRNTVMLIKRGEAYLADDDYDAAIADARKAIYIDPFAETAFLLVARAQLEAGQAEQERLEAMRLYGQTVLDMQSYLYWYPGSIRGWTLLGEARYLEGNLDKALEAYNQALVFDDLAVDVELAYDTQLATIDAHLGRARMYMERRLYPQAFAGYDRAVTLARELDTENVRALAGRAEAAFNMGDFRQARQDLETLMEVSPDATRRLMLGQVQVQLEVYEDATGTLTAALADGTLSAAQRATAHEYLARAYYHQAEAQSGETGGGAGAEGAVSPLVAQALAEIETALDGGPSAARYYYRGLIHELAGELEDARIDYEWVLSWQDVYGYAFRVDALDHLDAVNEALAEEAAS